MSPLPVPESPDAITAGWLTAALRETETIRTAAIESFTSETVGGRPGLIGNLLRVHPRYDRLEPGAPTSIVAKFPPSGDGWARDLAPLGLTEVRAYRELTDPALLPVPAVHYSGLDPDSNRGVLLLEDMGDDRVVQQMAGCTFGQASLAVRSIAGFHAAHWDDARPSDHDWLAPLNSSYVGDRFRHWLGEYCGIWPDPVSGFAPRLIEHFDRLRAMLITPPQTIVHGDFHSQNMFFGTESGQRELTLIDFQMIHLGCGAADVSRFIATSLQPELRRTIETALLDEYHSSLEAAGVLEYDFDRCLLDFRAGLLWNLVSPLVLHIMRIVNTGGEWPAELPMLERCMLAVRDWEAEDLFPG